ncbi:hypothetical protein ACWCXL_02785 [Streptomyces sp. NPDC001588]
MDTPSDVMPAPAHEPDERGAPEGPPQIVPRRHPSRLLTGAAALAVLALVLHSVVRNAAFQWDVVGRYLTTGAVLDGLLHTLWLTGAPLRPGLAHSLPPTPLARLRARLSVLRGRLHVATAADSRPALGGDR